MQPKNYLCLKAPALRYSTNAAVKIAHAAAQHGIGLHFDSHGTETVDRSNHLIEAMATVISPEMLGTTLPAALVRSAEDAEWAIAQGFSVRVVKGAWPDPSDPKRDLDTSFLDLIERLAGRARHVRIGTHNYALGRQAVERLAAAGTSCEIETLLGLPAAALIGWARQNGVKSRVYIPYGPGYLPNAMGVLRRNPRLAWTIAKAQIRVFSNSKAPRRSAPAAQSPASLSRSES
jgi:proline dehydrogenase